MAGRQLTKDYGSSRSRGMANRIVDPGLPTGASNQGGKAPGQGRRARELLGFSALGPSILSWKLFGACSSVSPAAGERASEESLSPFAISDRL